MIDPNTVYRLAGEACVSPATVRAVYAGKCVRPAMAAAIRAAAQRLQVPVPPTPGSTP